MKKMQQRSNQQKNEKIESLLGFAVKAGKVVYGIDSIESAKTRVYLAFMCKSVSENTAEKLVALAQRKLIPVLLCEKPLEDVVFRKNCKVLGVCDRQMAQAMLKFQTVTYHTQNSEVK